MTLGNCDTIDHSAVRLEQADRFAAGADIKTQLITKLAFGSFCRTGTRETSVQLEGEISFCGDTRSVRKNPFIRFGIIIRHRITSEIHRVIGAVVDFDPAAEIGIKRSVALCGRTVFVFDVVTVDQNFTEHDVVNAHLTVLSLIKERIARFRIRIAGGDAVSRRKFRSRIKRAVRERAGHGIVLGLRTEIDHIDDLIIC